jgi:hypothetical protein
MYVSDTELNIFNRPFACRLFLLKVDITCFSLISEVGLNVILKVRPDLTLKFSALTFISLKKGQKDLILRFTAGKFSFNLDRLMLSVSCRTLVDICVTGAHTVTKLYGARSLDFFYNLA